MSLELLLEILDFSNAYKANIFDDIQVEIIGFLTPETVDRSKFLQLKSFFLLIDWYLVKAEAKKQEAGALLDACKKYESANKELIIKSRVVAQV